MTASDLTTQIQQLDQRLAQVEATLLRIEHMLVELQAAPTDPSTVHLTRLPRRVRFVSPRLRRRSQAADFVMVVTRDS